MYNKEPTTGGHSEYQNAILNKFRENGYSVRLTEARIAGFICISHSESGFAVSYVWSLQISDEEQHELMTEFLDRAQFFFFFGTELDGPVEPQ